MLNIALPKGRLGSRVYDILERAGYGCDELKSESRKLIFESPENGVRYFWVKPSDTAIYVEHGAADIGVAGRDILLEYSPDVYEPLDLKTGLCRMAVAAKKGFRYKNGKTLTVATKFPHIARRYFEGRGKDIDIIKLSGSIEIAPILGMSDVIVDIVETGTTLKENGLQVLEVICPLSARVVVNQVSMKMENERITHLLYKLKGVIQK